MSELLPCPFCGGEADEYEGEYGNGIYCMECGAMVGEPIHLGFSIAERVSYEQAAKAWNTRSGGHCAFAYPTDLTDGCALIPERTCQQKRLFNLIRRECDGEWYEWHGEEKPNYCPNCGCKVVSE